ncbi:MAG: ribosomal protein S18-alanine N-acetyltransferase [Magnetococcales bacterium]|nr:ribosomal protein S18-alanine N-acetyltransferase [Magnetococcales bacterium]
MKIRSMLAADLPQVAALEATLHPTPWSVALFDEELTLGAFCRILEGASGELLGYSVARLLVDEWHLLTLGIAPACRRQGGAKRLLDDLIHHANTLGSQAILLEVRASNLPARTLYQDKGFQFLYTRRGYYRLDSGSEDAILLIYPLPGTTGQSSGPNGPRG